jgi:hypothetical protein
MNGFFDECVTIYDHCFRKGRFLIDNVLETFSYRLVDGYIMVETCIHYIGDMLIEEEKLFNYIRLFGD